MDRRFWYLIVQFALKDFKIRYTHSMLGYAWSVLNPLIFSGIYYFVFSEFLHFDVPNYPGYLLLGIVLWNFFAEGSGNGITALLARSSILTKVKLPREVVIYAAILNALITLGISLSILLILLRVTGTPLGWPIVTIPVAVLELVLLTAGVSLVLAPLHVRYHDIGYLWGVLMQIGFWLTPIIYFDTLVPSRWRWLIKFNPMTRIITQSREALVYCTWPGRAAMVQTLLFALAVMLGGLWSFRRLQARLIEHF